MHPVLIRKHKEKLKCVINYDEMFTDEYPYNITKTNYYDLMGYITKSLKKDVGYMYLSKWKELDFIEWKIFVDGNPLITIFTAKFVDNKITISARLTNISEEYGFR